LPRGVRADTARSHFPKEGVMRPNEPGGNGHRHVAGLTPFRCMLMDCVDAGQCLYYRQQHHVAATATRLPRTGREATAQPPPNRACIENVASLGLSSGRVWQSLRGQCHAPMSCHGRVASGDWSCVNPWRRTNPPSHSLAADFPRIKRPSGSCISAVPTTSAARTTSTPSRASSCSREPP